MISVILLVIRFAQHDEINFFLPFSIWSIDQGNWFKVTSQGIPSIKILTNDSRFECFTALCDYIMIDAKEHVFWVGVCWSHPPYLEPSLRKDLFQSSPQDQCGCYLSKFHICKSLGWNGRSPDEEIPPHVNFRLLNGLLRSVFVSSVNKLKAGYKSTLIERKRT